MSRKKIDDPAHENRHCPMYIQALDVGITKVIGHAGRGGRPPYKEFNPSVGLRGNSTLSRASNGWNKLGRDLSKRIAGVFTQAGHDKYAEILRRHFPHTPLTCTEAIAIDFLDNIPETGNGKEVNPMIDKERVWGGDPLPERLFGYFLDNDTQGSPRVISGGFDVEPGPRGVFFELRRDVEQADGPHIDGHFIVPEGEILGNFAIEDERGHSRAVFHGEFAGRILVARVVGARWIGDRPFVLGPEMEVSKERFDQERHDFEARHRSIVPA